MSGFRSGRREKRTQMKAVAQVKILPAPQWHGTGEWNGGGNTVPGCPEFAPLPIAVRVDAALLAGGRQLISTSRLTWVPPGAESRKAPMLESVVIPN
jgi:hypothetical protein